MINIKTGMRSSKALESFVEFCNANPGLRFWQALLSWSGKNYILFSNLPPYHIATKADIIVAELADTYGIEGKI